MLNFKIEFANFSFLDDIPWGNAVNLHRDILRNPHTLTFVKETFKEGGIN